MLTLKKDKSLGGGWGGGRREEDAEGAPPPLPPPPPRSPLLAGRARPLRRVPLRGRRPRFAGDHARRRGRG